MWGGGAGFGDEPDMMTCSAPDMQPEAGASGWETGFGGAAAEKYMTEEQKASEANVPDEVFGNQKDPKAYLTIQYCGGLT